MDEKGEEGGATGTLGQVRNFKNTLTRKPKDKKAPLELVHSLSTFIDLNYKFNIYKLHLK